jgi:hypothetical protein
MSVKVKIDIPTAKILKSRGLGSDTGARKYLASEVKRLCDPYVPMQQGMLKNLVTIAADGSHIVYTQPYAHYQYYGKVMAGRAPKQYTGDNLTYHGAPMRGPQWEKRMLADKSKDLETSMDAYIKKRG